MCVSFVLSGHILCALENRVKSLLEYTGELIIKGNNVCRRSPTSDCICAHAEKERVRRARHRMTLDLVLAAS